jgi:sarcosine oxidase
MATTREQVSYFPTADLDDLRPGRFPVWIWMDDPSFYGFPTFGPPEVADRLKGSEDCGGRTSSTPTPAPSSPTTDGTAARDVHDRARR